MLYYHAVTDYKLHGFMNILDMNSSYCELGDVLVNLSNGHHLAGDLKVRDKAIRKVLSHLVDLLFSQDHALTCYAFFLAYFLLCWLVLAHYHCKASI